MDAAGGEQLSLAAVRDALVRLEDSVVFTLLERARHPRNAPAYAPAGGGGSEGGRSLVEFFVREAEALNAKVLSRRIHIGKYVAEVKFKDAPQDYSPLVQAKDINSLMDLLTFKAVEEKVKKRVEKKARTFGQNVTLEDNAGKQESTASDSECKVDPTVLSKLYDQWVMPLTKDVEVEYLLRRLD
ncbi:unnamed protein product [Urochloa humidicola]